MPRHTLTVLHAPLHGPDFTKADAKAAMALGADSLAFSEANVLARWLRRRVRYRCRVMRSSIDTRRVRSPLGDAGDNPVMVKRGHKRLQSWGVMACTPSEPVRIAPARFLYGEAYAHPFGDVEHLSAHPNAGVSKFRTLRVPRVRKYAATMRMLEAKVRRAQDKGRLVIVTGDLQMSKRCTQRWSPDQTFRRLGLRTYAAGIDWIAYDPRLVLLEAKVLEPRPGHDHPWILATFGLRGDA